MTTKKSTTKKSTTKKASTNGDRKRAIRLPLSLTPPEGSELTFDGDKLDPATDDTSPMRRNPELSPEEEAKRLAHRKALTLKAFQTAYENHRRSRKKA